MSDVQKTQALEKFMEENSLTVLNNTALCTLLMKQQKDFQALSDAHNNAVTEFSLKLQSLEAKLSKQQEHIDEIAKNIILPSNGFEVRGPSLFDRLKK